MPGSAKANWAIEFSLVFEKSDTHCRDIAMGMSILGERAARIAGCVQVIPQQRIVQVGQIIKGPEDADSMHTKCLKELETLERHLRDLTHYVVSRQLAETHAC